MSFKAENNAFHLKIKWWLESWGISFDLPNYIIFYVHIFVKGVAAQSAVWNANRVAGVCREWPEKR